MATKIESNDSLIIDVENSNDSFNQHSAANEITDSSINLNDTPLYNDSHDDSSTALADDGNTSQTFDSDTGSKNQTKLTKEQQKALEIEFEKSNYINPKKAVELGHQLGLSKQNITIWFSNRRQKFGALRKKWTPSTDQLNVLKHEYSKNKYLDKIRRKALADKLKIDEKYLVRWFAMCRKKERSQSNDSAIVDSPQVPDSTEGKVSEADLSSVFNDLLDKSEEPDGIASVLANTSTDDNNLLIISLMTCLDQKTRSYYKHLIKIFYPELHNELNEINPAANNDIDDNTDETFQASLCETIEELTKSATRPKPAKRKRRSSKSSNITSDDIAVDSTVSDRATAEEEDTPAIAVTNQSGESKPAKRKRLAKSRRVSFSSEVTTEDDNSNNAPVQDEFSNSPISAVKRLSVANLSFSSEHDASNISASDINDTLPDFNNNSMSAKKKRIILTEDQITKLQEEFAKNVKIDKKRTSELADELKVSTNYIENWFRKQRSEQNIKLNTSLTPDVRKRLQEEYTKSPSLDKARKKLLAEELNVKETSIYTWFYRCNKKDKDAATPNKVVQ